MSLLQALPGGRKRHRLVPKTAPKLGAYKVHAIDMLRDMVQHAIEVEHTTIPAYLSTMYTIEDPTSFAYRTIQSVVMEEMLHMILAANVLNAIGGHPSIDHPKFVPEYPTYLPWSNKSFKVPLAAFAPGTIDVFIKVETPAELGAPPEPYHWETIGQFYAAIKDGLRYLDKHTPGGIFTGDPALQVTPEHYYGGGGEIIAVHNLKDAIEAIDLIVGQGEGVDGGLEDPDKEMFGEQIEYAHYFKFLEIKYGRLYKPKDDPKKPPTGPKVAVDWKAFYPMKENPKMEDYPVGSELYNATLEFNRTYMALLRNIHHATNGHPAQFRQAIPLMYDLKYKAQALIRVPLGNGTNAGPSFQYVPE